MIKKLLIANRGEIARRIIRTAHKMGINTVAVYSEADAQMPHVREAGQAVLLGPAAAGESYLNIEKVLAAARDTGADAIHPGYGFLSENAGFAKACEKAGIIFVGPTAAAIEAMGLKDEAKRIMDGAGVPTVPGYLGEDQSPQALEAAATRIGYPVLIKAIAGGGGKGMRRVERAEDFAQELQACQGEAKRAFGNDIVLIEKYVTAPRHVEVQVFSDSHGNHVHLFERDCSVQRRHQKVVEEAPAPNLAADIRAAMHDAAVKAASAITYRGAGTVEFILDTTTGAFYFMEMNTRLQVEHPVTEQVTGQDLVEWQLRIAAGETVPLLQDDIHVAGHSIEVRFYAEDPESGFLPSTGLIEALNFGQEASPLRVDTGVEAGNSVSIHYDPMIAKLISTGADRREAIERLRTALDATVVQGVKTNRAFLARVLKVPAFFDAELTTGFLTDHETALNAPTDVPDLVVWAASICAVRAATAGTTPWGHIGAWRLNGPRRVRVPLSMPGGEGRVHTVADMGDGLYTVDGAQHVTVKTRKSGMLDFHANGETLQVFPVVEPGAIELRTSGETYVFARPDYSHGADAAGGGDGAVTAPMPGSVLNVLTSAGDSVEAGDGLLVLEAMKMEHRLSAPISGTVTLISVAAGDQVRDGDVLIEIEALSADEKD